MTEEEIFNYLIDNLRLNVETVPYDGKYVTLELRKPSARDDIYYSNSRNSDDWHNLGSIAIDERRAGYF